MTVTVALALAGGAMVPVAAATERTAPRPTSVDGVWRVEGYGAVLSIAAGRLREYQTTDISCLKGDSAKRTAPGEYRAADGTVLTVRTEGARHGSLHLSGSAGDRQLRRVAELPEGCGRPMPKDPVAAFDVFWQSFEENYPFFAAKGIDWHAVRDAYRPKVHADTTRAELFAVFSKMVKPLYDAHVAVFDGERRFYQVRPGTTAPGEKLDTKVKNHIVRRDLKGHKPQEFAGGRISYADLPGSGQGYLRISGFAGYNTKDPSYAAQLAELDKALDTVLTPARTASLKGLIIDLRVNGGGSDALGLHIAERLTDTPYIAYRKRTQYTEPQPIPVRPARDAPRYTGPVAVLTGGSTVSAGETFTQALIDRPGRTVRIGQPTQGVFSDVMDRRLPNGMAVWLPNEEFLTRSGGTFDGPGIPPHVRTPVFTKEEFEKNRDSAFDKAVALLRD
ncbi:S41 family peptidase [Streptomyces kanamyceticus]|uniref:Protease n=1 Tax=Streptomyces kanamyceticus TaxID=1967 RepID=A0A5J6GAN5_STRKN|nr:S41 family peptidase [Streptomyces kanamyceticus]QEU90881.1 protease [Streptomyces kanamyceticus]